MATVGDMPKMTDYVREAFRRRERPWRRVELPEWWTIATWAGAAGIAAILVAGALTGGSEGATKSGGAVHRFTPQTLDPRSATTAPSSTLSPTASPSAAPTSSASASVDFTDSTPVQVRQTGGGTTVVPAGARNLALAAARAKVTGVWTGIPTTSAAHPAAPPPAPSPDVAVGHLSVQDPAVTGNSRYRFTAKVKRAGGRAHAVRILVEAGQGGYVVQGH